MRAPPCIWSWCGYSVSPTVRPGRCNRARPGRDGILDVLWEVPKDQVLRFSVAGERQQAVLEAARHLLPDPEAAVCPPELALDAWLRRVYDLMRTVGGIGVPGEPTLRALQDRNASVPQVLSRDAYLLVRAGLKRPRSARR